MIKISRSKIDLYLECPRCFWLDVKRGVRRPSPAPYTINNAIDLLLKQDFDFYRYKQKPHPIMKKFNIDALPYNHPQIDKWRSNFFGIKFYHKPTDLLIFGGIDDVWVNSIGEIIVVDYKATGANQHKIYDSYKRQMEIYQWLFKKNNFKVSPIGYFVFARVNKSDGFESINPNLSFELFIEKYRGNTKWIEKSIYDVKKILNLEKSPNPSSNCQFCIYYKNCLNVS